MDWSFFILMNLFVKALMVLFTFYTGGPPFFLPTLSNKLSISEKNVGTPIKADTTDTG